MVTGTADDTLINNLIGDFIPALRAALLPAVVQSEDTDLQGLINFAACEWVCGEYLSIRLRADGALDSIALGGAELTAFRFELADPFGLKAQANARLAPYLRGSPVTPGARGVSYSEAELP